MLRVNLLPKLTSADYNRRWLAKQTPEYLAKRKAAHKARALERYTTDSAYRERKLSATKDWCSRNPRKGSRRSAHLHWRYGLCVEDVLQMLADQKGCCGICGDAIGFEKSEEVKKLHIDHDHTTGKIRKLLCGPCNQGLGLFREDVGCLRKAIEYLEVHRGSSGTIDTQR